ncbi:MAG: HAMP domain-containing histidine kinase [Chloroflexi bacterium]|nr:HAMP domain-containing histidine kinase [Chloroflexota bacterium]
METELQRLKGAFVAIISHELRTPLTEIITALELLENGYGGSLTEQQRGYVAIAGRAAEHLNMLIGDLIAFAQLQAETLETRREPTDLAELVARVVEQHRPRAQAKQLTLSFSAAPRLGPIPVDRALLTRVVSNLIINAINFTPAQGCVSVHVAPEPDEVRIVVQDTGVGIAKEKQARLFESFYQAADPLTRQVGGLGIGLAYARRIVEAHRGRITFESEEGKGSTFTVHLPLK